MIPVIWHRVRIPPDVVLLYVVRFDAHEYAMNMHRLNVLVSSPEAAVMDLGQPENVQLLLPWNAPSKCRTN